jgi:hypothetical protein
MKTNFQAVTVLLTGAVLFLTASFAEARVYGVASGPHRTVVSGPRGVAVAGPNGAGAVRRRPVVVAPRPVVVAPRPVVVAPLPRGYVRVVPTGYRTVFYRGYNCRFVGGVYYRPVLYGGSTVYVTLD